VFIKDIPYILDDVKKLNVNFKRSFINFLEKKKLEENALKDTKHAKGKRLILNLPLNGQRTKTNAKTIRKLKKI